MKKYLLLLIVILGMSCGANERAFVIKVSLPQNPEEPQIKAVEYFRQVVEEKTAGGVRVQIYPNNQLGNQRDVTEGIQLGTIEMSNVASVMASFVPEVNIFELPFLFENREHFYAVLDSEIGESLRSSFARRGFHYFGCFDAGVRHIMTVNKPLHTAADLVGLKIRTMENPLHLAAFKAFGANPLPMAYGELYTALEQKVIDGAEAANTNYFSKKFFEPAPYWAQIGWIHLVEYVVMSLYFYERLPDEYRMIIDDAAQQMIALERVGYRTADEETLQKLVDAGVQLTYPDKDKFLEASQQVYKDWAEKVGGMELIERIRRFEYTSRIKE